METTDYDKQTLYLFGLIDRKCLKENSFHWNYHLDLNGKRLIVCQRLFLSVHQISKKRIEILQQKIIANKSLSDQRGRHNNRFKIDDKS